MAAVEAGNGYQNPKWRHEPELELIFKRSPIWLSEIFFVAIRTEVQLNFNLNSIRQSEVEIIFNINSALQPETKFFSTIPKLEISVDLNSKWRPEVEISFDLNSIWRPNVEFDQTGSRNNLWHKFNMTTGNIIILWLTSHLTWLRHWLNTKIQYGDENNF